MTDIDAMADLIVRTIRTRGRQVDVTAESAIRDAMRALVPRQRGDAMTELVTEEMIETALDAYFRSPSLYAKDMMHAALRAVAPLIAARMSYDAKLRMCDRAVAAEREACAKVLLDKAQEYNRLRDPGMANHCRALAAVIRARGTP